VGKKDLNVRLFGWTARLTISLSPDGGKDIKPVVRLST
jgi:hypothetical protein